MKKIGLVGGTGPESTLMYYKELNSRIDALTEGSAMPDVAIESVNFRKAPGLNGALIAAYPVGTAVTVLQKAGDWCKVEIGGQQGYVSAWFLK